MGLEADHVVHNSDRVIGQQIHFFRELSSTNDLAAEWGVDRRHHGTVIVADQQSAGRGQHGRVWQASPGSSLLCSVIVVPPPQLLRPVILTAWVAVSLRSLVHDLVGIPARIKWPNDLLVHGKKLSGILIEQRGATIVGFGVNLTQSATDFADAGLPEATSLQILGGQRYDREDVLDRLLSALDQSYAGLLKGDYASLEQDWNDGVGMVGHDVRIEAYDGSVILGRLRELTFQGLTLEDELGTRVVAPETVRQLMLL